MNKVKVNIEFEWEFDKKEWQEHLDHMDKIKDDIRIKLGFDFVSTFYYLNAIIYPKLVSCKINNQETDFTKDLQSAAH